LLCGAPLHIFAAAPAVDIREVERRRCLLAAVVAAERPPVGQGFDALRDLLGPGASGRDLVLIEVEYVEDQDLGGMTVAFFGDLVFSSDVLGEFFSPSPRWS
jgi:hypothetical protein